MSSASLRRRVCASAITFVALIPPALAEDDPTVLDEISVTATRSERATKDVPQSISVIGSERIEAERMFNIKDALSGTAGVQVDSKNGGSDVRLSIRGAGIKAAYGVREIMVLRDGVPMSDPDSFTRFDFIDTQDIDRIEVAKGPGSIFSTGSAGGTIQILSKSVFDQTANRARIGLGTQGAQNLHMRWGGMIDDTQAVAVTASRRVLENGWRHWNNFETNQAGFKYGRIMPSGGTWDSEISFSNSFTQLPGTMNTSQFNEYRTTGRQNDNSDAFKNSGRDAWTLFGNTRYEQDFGDFTFRPRVYANHWEHYHPVTGVINVSEGNYIFGTDIEGEYRHNLAGMNSTLVGGVTLRADLSLDARKYAYRDYTTAGTRIKSTLSDRQGGLLETQDTKNYLAGVFAQETLTPTDRLSVDLGGRVDRSMFEIDTDKRGEYNYATGNYTWGASQSQATPSFTLVSPKIGASYKLTPTLTAYASLAQGDQIPSSSELTSNPGLTTAQSRNYEIGLKHRSNQWQFDAALYYNPVKDDIVQVYENGQSVYQNAGQTEKKGFDGTLTYRPLPGLSIGGSYTYSDYTYDRFAEITGSGAAKTTTSRAGNRVPLIPMHQYSLFAQYRHDSGLNARIQTISWGEYWMDNANTEKYGGYSFVTNVSLGWDITPEHAIALNIDNVFDQHYATEAKKDTNGSKTFGGAAPRSFLATYTLKF
ncbi:TonB-dependent receptor [Magnetospirillum sulfuroxidans]|uniref:TonB-dependent receptor n=1 Tax=Magnetospirillum sulfuroxidans TaxID=611300 RepID=A0ABS5I941_9PROT|nr:TonB-dependent receptor [Magnetospirillum sulfuroxidans]MBR9970944.1 TonB-dependent receptor [Magnetospirillum sulfuroxidans]